MKVDKTGLAIGGNALRLAVGAFILLPYHLATAQGSSESSTPAANPQRGQLEEVVVTARKQKEQLQKAPLGISALSSEVIQQQNIVRLDAVRDLVPNLDVGVTAGSTTAANIYIRGIGTYDYQIYTDAPVTVYIDGVLNARPDASLFEVADLERVEVLRGPQGTLFGRNTTGGAISLITKGPADEVGVQQKIGYGTDNELTTRTIINTGELGHSGFKAKFIYAHHQRDGYVHNFNVGRDDDSPGMVDSNSFWFALHGDLSSNLRVDYRMDYTDHRAQQPLSQMIVAVPDVLTYFGQSPSFGGDPLTFSPKPLGSAYAGDQPADHNKFAGHALTLEYDANDALTFRNILAYRSTSVDEYINISGQGNLKGLVLDLISGTPVVGDVTPFNDPHNVSRDHQISNELQALGTLGEFKYVAGLYYFYEKGSLLNPNLFTAVLPGGALGINLNLTRYAALTTKSYAGYGQLSFRPGALNDKFELTAGVRYTHDKKEIDENTTFNGAPSVVRNVSDSWKNVSGLLSASYQWTDDVMTYARVANAYRAGGFVPNTVNSYDPEKALSYEVGVKSDWLDRHLRVNASIFKTDYKDLQVQNIITGLPVITNAGKATYTGAELEITAVPTDNWQLQANLGYVEPKYQRYLFVDTAGNELNIADEAKFNGVSKLNYNLGAQYAFAPSKAGLLTARVDYAYRTSKVWFPLDRSAPFNEVIATKAHGTLKARLTLDEIPVGNFKLRADLWGANLLNKKVVAAGNDFGTLGFGTVVFERLRTVGIDLTADF